MKKLVLTSALVAASLSNVATAEEALTDYQTSLLYCSMNAVSLVKSNAITEDVDVNATSWFITKFMEDKHIKLTSHNIRLMLEATEKRADELSIEYNTTDDIVKNAGSNYLLVPHDSFNELTCSEFYKVGSLDK